MSQEINPTNDSHIETPSDVQPMTSDTPVVAGDTPLVASVPAQSFTPPAIPSPPAPEHKPAWRMFIAPAWFFFGILIGLGLFAAYDQLTPKPITPPAVQSIDEATVRQAARDGLIQAIQTIQASSAQGNSSQGPSAVDKNAFALRDANILGDKNAPVTVVEYADFQCPYCGKHYKTVEPGLIQDYVNTGKVKLVYKHLAFLGAESVYAAVAAECAADQGKFWQFHNYLFDHQAGENQGAFNKDKLLTFGTALNLDMPTFTTCVNGDQTISRVQADTEEAQKFGVTSTPTFFVNGKPLVGVASPDEFKQAIEQALNQ